MTIRNLTAVPADQRRRMTKEETAFFAGCTLGDLQPDDQRPQPVKPDQLPEVIDKLFGGDGKIINYFPVAVLLKRLQAFTPDTLYEPLTVAWAGVLSDRPGVSVLWAYTIYQRTLELGRPYRITDWVDDFPDGPPTSEGMNVIWDAQKSRDAVLGNLLDERSTWDALAKEKETTDA